MSNCNGAWPPPISSTGCFSDVLTLINKGTVPLELAPGIVVQAGQPIDWTGFGAVWEILEYSGQVLKTLTADAVSAPAIVEPTASGLWLPGPRAGGQMQFFLAYPDVQALGCGSTTWSVWAVSPAGNRYALFTVVSTIV